MKTILDLPTGLHHAIPPAIYHRRHMGLVSKGALDRLHRSPLHYKAWIDGTVTDEETEALVFGGAFHCRLLEPERYKTAYAIRPAFDEYRDTAGKLSSKLAKAAVKTWRDSIGEAKELEADDESRMVQMVESIRRHPLASRILLDGEAEVTARWIDEETGLQCKARADYFVRKRRMVADVKTTSDASYAAFRRDVVNYRYHVQDALYRAGFAAAGAPIDYFVIVAVEKTPPYAVATYTLDSEGIQRGYAHTRTAITTLAEALRNDEWPGYPVTIQTLELPPWAA